MKKEDYTVNNVSLEHIRNRFEVIVIKLMKQFIPLYPDFDNCPICIEDVYALALSRIPSVYVQNASIVFEDEKMINENVEEIVKYAIYQVKNNPKH